MFAADLEEYEMQDIEAGLTHLGKRTRREGETAFPDMGTMRAQIGMAEFCRVSDQVEQREKTEDEALRQRRKDHPEEFMDESDWAEIAAKARGKMMMQ